MSDAGGAPRTAAEARRSHLESERWRKILIGGVRHIPVAVQEATIPAWAALFYPQVPGVRRALLSNLARLGEGGELAAFRTFTNYCRSVAQAYRFYLGEAPPRGEVTGGEHLREALAEGRGAVLVTGHLGSWQVGPHLLGGDGLPPVTVVMSEEPDAGAQQLEGALRARRMRVVSPGRSPALGLELRAALGRGEVVALQLDRPVGNARLTVPLLDGEAELASGPAELARVCQAPVVPVCFPVVGRRIAVRVEPPQRCSADLPRRAAVRELTERLAEVYGRWVSAHPHQWYNFFAFWS